MKNCNEKYKILRLFVQTYRTNEPILVKFEGKFDNKKWREFIFSIYSNILYHEEREITNDLVDLGCEGNILEKFIIFHYLISKK